MWAKRQYKRGFADGKAGQIVAQSNDHYLNGYIEGKRKKEQYRFD